MWIDKLREKTRKADKFPLAQSYEEIKAEIEEVASYGQDFHYFHYPYMSDETREKLRQEGLLVVDVMEMMKTCVSWKEETNV